MQILTTRRDLHNPHHPQQMVTAVMVESVANDVAVYWMAGHHPAEDVAARGHKMTEREALATGFTIPAGKHYRR